MTFEDVVVIGIAVAVVGVGLAGARIVSRRLLARRERLVEELSDRGTTYGSDFLVRIALLIVWFGCAIGSLFLLPGLAWVFDPDPEDMWDSALRSLGVDPGRLVGLKGGTAALH